MENFIFTAQFDDASLATVNWTLPDGSVESTFALGQFFDSSTGCNEILEYSYEVLCEDGSLLEEGSFTVTVYTFNEAIVEETEPCTFIVFPDCPDDVVIEIEGEAGNTFVAESGTGGTALFGITNNGAPEYCKYNFFDFNFDCTADCSTPELEVSLLVDPVTGISPVADPVTGVYSICPSETLNFEAVLDLSTVPTPTIVNYFWEGPNLWSSSDQNPILMNAPPGTYTVYVEVDACVSQNYELEVNLNCAAVIPSGIETVSSVNWARVIGGTEIEFLADLEFEKAVLLDMSGRTIWEEQNGNTSSTPSINISQKLSGIGILVLWTSDAVYSQKMFLNY